MVPEVRKFLRILPLNTRPKKARKLCFRKWRIFWIRLFPSFLSHLRKLPRDSNSGPKNITIGFSIWGLCFRNLQPLTMEGLSVLDDETGDAWVRSQPAVKISMENWVHKSNWRFEAGLFGLVRPLWSSFGGHPEEKRLEHEVHDWKRLYLHPHQWLEPLLWHETKWQNIWEKLCMKSWQFWKCPKLGKRQ